MLSISSLTETNIEILSISGLNFKVDEKATEVACKIRTVLGVDTIRSRLVLPD